MPDYRIQKAHHYGPSDISDMYLLGQSLDATSLPWKILPTPKWLDPEESVYPATIKNTVSH